MSQEKHNKNYLSQYTQPVYPNKFTHPQERDDKSSRRDSKQDERKRSQIFEPQSPVERLNQIQSQQAQQAHQQQQSHYQQQNTVQFTHQACIYHQNQYITNFCQDETCFLPLCPECINQHIQFHQAQNSYPKIEKIEHTQNQCCQKVIELVGNMHQNHNDVHQILKNYERDQIQVINEKLGNARQMVLDVVNNYFDKLQIEIHSKLKKQQEQNIEELETANRFINQKIADMQNLQYKLNGDKSLKYIVRLMSSNYLEQMESFNKDCRTFLVNFEHVKLLDIETHEPSLYSINLELSKFVKAKNSAIQPSQQIQIDQQPKQSNIFQNDVIHSPPPKQFMQAQPIYQPISHNTPPMIPISNQDIMHPQQGYYGGVYQQRQYPLSNFEPQRQEFYQPNIQYAKDGSLSYSHVI